MSSFLRSRPRPRVILHVTLLLPALVLVLAAFGGGRPGGDGDGAPGAAEMAVGKVADGGRAAGDGGSASKRRTMNGADWPIFGRGLERAHSFGRAPDPPFHREWEFFAGQLLEFPPALSDGVLYIANKTGQIYAVDARTGRRRWQHKLGYSVTAPTVDGELLYLAQEAGQIAALDKRTGHRRWTFDANAKLESSPLIVRGTIYLGTGAGELLALDASSGKLRWKRSWGSPVKASPSFHDGVVYFGDYAGIIHAVSAEDGSPKWSFDTSEVAPGGAGCFYSSPAIAFGHVYEARNDGVLYALRLDGKLDWHLQTGGGIYGSPAAADIRGAGQSVYVGSYDHHLYALDAETGRQRWTHDMGGRIDGTATVIGSTVYTASMDTSETRGIDAVTGNKVWRWGTAGFTPMISDGTHNFLSGYQTVWAFTAKRGR